ASREAFCQRDDVHRSALRSRGDAIGFFCGGGTSHIVARPPGSPLSSSLPQPRPQHGRRAYHHTSAAPSARVRHPYLGALSRNPLITPKSNPTDLVDSNYGPTFRPRVL